MSVHTDEDQRCSCKEGRRYGTNDGVNTVWWSCKRCDGSGWLWKDGVCHWAEYPGDLEYVPPDPEPRAELETVE